MRKYVFVCLILFVISCDESLKLKSKYKEVVTVENQDSILESELTQCVELLKKEDTDKYRTTHEKLLLEFKFIDKIKAVIEKGYNHSNKNMNDKALLLQKQLESFQKYEFPYMRKEYARLLNMDLSNESLNVTVENDKIYFSSYQFFSDREISDIFNGLKETMQLYRFKRAYFETKLNDSFYYDIQAKKDIDL